MLRHSSRTRLLNDTLARDAGPREHDGEVSRVDCCSHPARNARFIAAEAAIVSRKDSPQSAISVVTACPGAASTPAALARTNREGPAARWVPIITRVIRNLDQLDVHRALLLMVHGLLKMRPGDGRCST